MKKLISVVIILLISLGTLAFGELDSALKVKENWVSTSIGFNANYLQPDFYTNEQYRVSRGIITPGVNLLISYHQNQYFNMHVGVSVDCFETRANVPATSLNSYVTSNIKSKYSFCSFPLLYSLNLFKSTRDFNISPFIGGALAFLLSNETEVERSNGEFIQKNWFVNDVGSLFFTLGLKASYKLNSKLEFFVGAIGNKQISPMIYYNVNSAGNPIEEKQWLVNFQSQIGINYKW